ncbi:MAG: hypothetical protein RBR87_05115 [Bacteroidales bacterium]|jgi:hypothetical protein|nr:hypothetical protein [Bacteroidales bacterium]
MITSNIDIIKAAGRIIVRSGIPGLTMETLKQEPEIFGKRLPKEIENESKLFELLLLEFELEISVLVTAITKQKTAPDEEISLIFKGLYKLFKHNHWYLDLAFDPDVLLRCAKAEDIIFRIKRLAKSYLNRLIQRGKKEDIFAITESTPVLVNEILEGFRALINDWQLADKMIKDIQYVQPAKD